LLTNYDNKGQGITFGISAFEGGQVPDVTHFTIIGSLETNRKLSL